MNIAIKLSNIRWPHAPAPTERVKFSDYLYSIGVDYHKLVKTLEDKKIIDMPKTLPNLELLFISDGGDIYVDAPEYVFTNEFLTKLQNVVKMITIDCSRYKKEEENMNKTVCKSSVFTPRSSGRYPWSRMYPAQNVPEAIKVEFFDEGQATIKVTFGDGTHTTATCSNNDVFDFDVGLGICIAKRALGTKFNRLIEKAHKLYIRQEDEKLKAAEEEKQAAIREVKKLEKKRMKAEKREAEWRQAQIDILAEAIKKAREDSGSEEVTHKDVFKIAAHMVKASREREDRNKKIVELYKQGKSYKDISKELGISRTTVGRVIRESNKH